MSAAATSRAGLPEEDAAEPRPDGPTPARGLSLPVALAISTSAIAIAAVRLAWPSLKLDSVTFGLLIVALIPWLAPVLRSLKAFGVEVDFQEFRHEVTQRLGEHDQEIERQQETVQDIASTVQRLAPLVVSGATPEQATFLEKLLGEFNAYLRSLELPLSDPPAVSLETQVENAYYEPTAESGTSARIVVHKDLAGDADVVLREYLHHVLLGLRPGHASDEDGGRAIESGLADYVVCSFGDSPVLGERAALVYREVWALDRPYIRNLKNARMFAEVEAFRDVGEVWGATFWDVHHRLGKSLTDRLLLATWRDAPALEGQPALSPLIDTLVAKVAEASGPADADAVAQVFAART